MVLARIPGFIPGLGRSAREGNGYPLQCSGLENSMDCIVRGVAKNRTRLSNFHFHYTKEDQSNGDVDSRSIFFFFFTRWQIFYHVCILMNMTK